MNKDLVCTFETAKRLKALGAPQDTAFIWYDDAGKPRLYPSETITNINDTFAAFTATETSKSFPPEIWILIDDKSLRRREAALYFLLQKGIYKVSLMIKNSEGKDFYELQRFEDANEAEARARMYAYILENNMLERGA